MQQLEMYIQVLKVQYWLEKAQGLPVRSCLYLNLKGKIRKTHHVPFSNLQYIRQSFYTAVITVLN